MNDLEDEKKQSDALCRNHPQPNTHTKIPTRRFKKTLLVLGLVEIFLGIAFCSLIIVMDIFAHSQPYYESRGLPVFEIFGAWDGISVFTCGIIAFVAYYRPSRSVFLANFALSIMTANSMLVRGVIASDNAYILSLYHPYGPLFICNILCSINCFACVIGFVIHFTYFCFALSRSTSRRVVVQAF